MWLDEIAFLHLFCFLKGGNVLESEFQAKLIKTLKSKYPGCEILKNDVNYKQGFPDLLIMVGMRYAVLECKASKDEPYRPN